MRTRRLITAATATMVLMGAGLAHAAPSGSTESGNEVSCYSKSGRAPEKVETKERNGGIVVEGNTGSTYAGQRGVEACGDNGGSWRGRAIVTSDQGGYAAYDGSTWGTDPVAGDEGCVRLDADGAHQGGGSAENDCR